MMKHLTIVLVASLAQPAMAANDHATETETAEQARIPFAATNGIRNFRASERDVLLIEGQFGRWYRAEFMGPCPGLRFTQRLGFDTNSDGSFDRFSRVVTPDGPCQVDSLVRIPDPDESVESDDTGS